MTTDARWQPFGIAAETWENEQERGGVRHLLLSLRRPRGDSDHAAGSALITTAAALLGLLAAGLFVVSLAAQYRYVLAEKHQVAPAVIEAIGLDVGMAIFSLLALGLAMAGQSARIERALVVACALGSALMNYAAANGGSPRSVAAYIMPPIFLAIVVDRVVAVVRRHVLGETERSAWTAFGLVALYGLRFALAAPSTASGLRRQVLDMTPLPAAPGPDALLLPLRPATAIASSTARTARQCSSFPPTAAARAAGSSRSCATSRPARHQSGHGPVRASRRSHARCTPSGRPTSASLVTAARRPVSSSWCRTATASWTASIPRRSAGSRASSPRGRPEHRLGPVCPRQARPRLTERPLVMRAKAAGVAAVALILLVLATRAAPGRPARRGRAPARARLPGR